MTQRRASETLVRQWQLVASLGASPFGCTVRQLTEGLNVSRSTLYRDLLCLRTTGVAVESTTVSGKVYLRLPEPLHQAVTPSPLQLAALKLARRCLAGLEGTSGVRELDALIAKWSASSPRSIRVQRPSCRARSAAVQWVEAALARGENLVLVYRADDGWSLVRRRVTPLAWSQQDGELCLVAVNVDDSTTGFFPESRIVRVECDPEQASESEEPASTRVARVGAPIEVEVRLSACVARHVARHPLGECQTVECDSEGTLIVRATVGSLEDARRWVLSWGAEAEALSPDELRSSLAEEAHRMDTLYWRRPFGLSNASKPADPPFRIGDFPGTAAAR